ncbi:hypothetical protein HOH87_01675 [bacterium]|jgi:hypothetical protein|nr:hypothetical protein [bacterium]
MKRLGIWIAIVLLFSPLGFGLEVSPRYAKAIAGARASGAGNASVAQPQDSDSIFSNPALMSHSGISELSFTGYEFFQTQYTLLNGSYEWNDWVVGVGMAQTGVKDVPEATYSGGTITETGSSVANSNTIYKLGISRALLSNLWVGANASYTYHQIHNSSASGVGADVGLAFDISPHIRLGLAMDNVSQPVLKWSDSYEETLASTLRFGTAFKLDSKTTLLMDYHKTGSDKGSIHAGVEQYIHPLVQVRFGTNNSGLTTGATLSLRNLKINIAYSMSPEAHIDDVFRFGLGYQIQ